MCGAITRKHTTINNPKQIIDSTNPKGTKIINHNADGMAIIKIVKKINLNCNFLFFSNLKVIIVHIVPTITTYPINKYN
jgi:hypothetical protein